MNNATLGTLVRTHGVDVDPHLDRDDLVPVSAGLQRQGDIILIPAETAGEEFGTGKQVPAIGVPVVQGENGGNTHRLLADGDVTWSTDRTTSSHELTIGCVVVAEGATAYLAHPEHGYAGIAPGRYVIRRQQEQADVIRMVQD